MLQLRVFGNIPSGIKLLVNFLSMPRFEPGFLGLTMDGLAKSATPPLSCQTNVFKDVQPQCFENNKRNLEMLKISTTNTCLAGLD
jgi:hypothetical protein